MRNSIYSALLGFALVVTGYTSFSTTTAEARVVCNGNACTAAGRAANAPAVRGAKAPTTSKMACIRAVSYGPTEIVWVNGNERNYVNAPVITSQRRASGYTRTFELNGGWVVVESCVKASLLAGVKDLTICNGTKRGEGYHWSLTRGELSALKKGGHASSYVPLLKTKDIMSLSAQTVRASYRRHYR